MTDPWLAQFPALDAGARLALDTLHHQPARGIPTWTVFLMEHAHLERLAGAAPGGYRRDPRGVYLAAQRAIGACAVDQFIPENPLSMGDAGYDGAAHGATTGAEAVTLDGIVIDGPEAVAAHLERVVFPQLRAAADAFDEDAAVADILAGEAAVQRAVAPGMLKTGYGFIHFPVFAYGLYGYVPYFSAYALYPELIERHFALQADLALRRNRAAARAYREGGLPPLFRLDFDMADSRGLLVDVRTLDRLWLPHFARCLAPVLAAGVRLIWHCDGNLMALVPRLLDVGLHGFQGFQYECGMDYAALCALRTRDGDPLTIIAGVSSATTLPHGTPADVKRELDFLVAAGPRTGLFLTASSSVTPGVPWANIATLVEGLRYYRAHGRA
jgi:hypothetical protein